MTRYLGPECVECEGIRIRTLRSGWSADNQRIREHRCMDCGHRAVSVQVYLPEGMTTFWRLNPTLIARDRGTRYRRIGKGVYRLPNRRTVPDRVAVSFAVSKGGAAPATHCNKGHEFTPENTYTGPKGLYRDCRTCKRNRDRRKVAA